MKIAVAMSRDRGTALPFLPFLQEMTDPSRPDAEITGTRPSTY
jgi:hypothetical protein